MMQPFVLSLLADVSMPPEGTMMLLLVEYWYIPLSVLLVAAVIIVALVLGRRGSQSGAAQAQPVPGSGRDDGGAPHR